MNNLIINKNNLIFIIIIIIFFFKGERMCSCPERAADSQIGELAQRIAVMNHFLFHWPQISTPTNHCILSYPLLAI